MNTRKRITLGVLSLLVLAGLIIGCGERFPSEPEMTANPIPGDGDVTFGLYKQENGEMRKLTGIDEYFYEIYANFTTPWYTWMWLDEDGYWVYALNWNFAAVADTGLAGVMVESLYVAVGDTSNLHLLAGLKTELNGNYYKFRVFPDYTLENYSSSHNTYWVKFFHGESDQGDRYQGSPTNWSERSSERSWWPVEAETNVIFQVYENGQGYIVDTLLYAVSYDAPYPDGSPIDTCNVEDLLEYGGDWFPVAYLNDDGTWEAQVGYPIRIWLKP